ncbi:beta-ketoadipyl CoA thiolase, partial [Pseudomonas psychrophila]
MTTDELRAELERKEQRYKDVYGGEVTTYAAQPEPERKPWRKRASLLDK